MRWLFSARYATIFTSWRSRKNLSKSEFKRSNSGSASWETYAPARYRSNTMSAAVRVASAKPLPQSNTARTIRSALRGTEKAPASLSASKICRKFNNSWKTIVDFENLSMNGSPCRPSYPACVSAKNGGWLGMKTGRQNHRRPSENEVDAAKSIANSLVEALQIKGQMRFETETS